jgi:cell division protein FtsZ
MNTLDIKVIGIGGCGCNVIGGIFDVTSLNAPMATVADLSSKHEVDRDIHFIAMNTDRQALERTVADARIFLGGDGIMERPDPETVTRLVEDKTEEIKQTILDAGMVILVAGMGGNTGTNAAPVVARFAGELGIRTAGFVTKPFAFEGNKRMEQAEKGISELQSLVDTLTVFHNDKLLKGTEPNTSLADAFRLSDHAIRNGIWFIADTAWGQCLPRGGVE